MSARHVDKVDLTNAAEQHGWADDPDHEVGDLQNMFYAAWEIMTEEQKVAFFANRWMEAILDGPEYEGIVDQLRRTE